MIREKVLSEEIASIGYNESLGLLEIQYVNGCIDKYFRVPHTIYKELMLAESKSEYFRQNIKESYISESILRVED